MSPPTKKRAFAFLAFVLLTAGAMMAECAVYFPKSMQIFHGETVTVRQGAPYTLEMQEETGDTDAVSAAVKLFGVIPVREVSVDVLPETRVVPLGKTMGIKLFTKGLMCVGTEAVLAENGKKIDIAEKGGIKNADMLLSANGTPLSTVEQLEQIVQSSGGAPITFLVQREGKEDTVTLTPAKTKDGYKLGIWVRDSTAGIGTVTFYDPATRSFGALGHPITDVDTGALMPVKQGSLTGAKIVDVKKGKRGAPGELCGMFDGNGASRGAILKNTPRGIYGVLAPDFTQGVSQEAMPVASKSQVSVGEAQIYAEVSDQGIQCFDVEIIKIMKYSTDDKNFVVHIKDERLLSATGGIVQGMSGSPIIQNGKLIGAVTHVFVNDPTRGYGIFIENMLAEAEKIK